MPYRIGLFSSLIESHVPLTHSYQDIFLLDVYPTFIIIIFNLKSYFKVYLLTFAKSREKLVQLTFFSRSVEIQVEIPVAEQ